MRYLTYIFLAGLTLLVIGCSTSTGDIDSTLEATAEEQPAAEITPTTEIVNGIPKSTNCVLTGGEVVEDGWSGKDTGSNSCNQCRCMEGGLACTKMACVSTATAKPTPTPTPTQTPTEQIFVKWSNWETGEWSPSSTPPKCGPLEDMFDVFPLDIAVVDEFTPPGRPGGDGSYYISHGHLRSHNTPHDQITVKFPAEGFSLYAASRRLQDYSVHGKTSTDEEQVKLHFHHPCGIKIMIDHIAQITDRWSEITASVPVLVNDSRETFMPDGQYLVESGEVLGYAIGHSTNTYLDFGVYDLREKNNVSEIMERDFPQYAATASHGICWANLFGAETQKLLEGKAVSSSDFCEIPKS